MNAALADVFAGRNLFFVWPLFIYFYCTAADVV